MPSQPTRWGLLALLTLFLVTCLTAQPTLARNTYELNDATEGDPGDGVLKPLAPTSGAARQPEVIRYYDTGVPRTPWGSPIFVLPINLSGVPVLLMLPADGWTSGLDWARSGGRWPHAR